MRIAFYAPMKAANHPRPSGDRELARLFPRALQGAGCEVLAASLLRSWEGRGDAGRQAAIRAHSEREAAQLVRTWRERAPDAWFTYHLYHKAPDWIGPPVCRALGIPYLVAEASLAPRQQGGPWDEGYRATREALRGTAAVVCMNPRDRAALAREIAPQRLHELKPFRELPPLPHARAPNRVPRIVTVAMLRSGDKVESLRQLAAALSLLPGGDWRLDVIGDGPARPEVERLFEPLGSNVRLLGLHTPREVLRRLPDYDLCAWPAHREAFGMALLEAQMCGLPVVAGRTEGVASIVRDGLTGLLAPPGDTEAFAAALRSLLADARARARLSRNALAIVREEHSLAAASATLARILAGLG